MTSDPDEKIPALSATDIANNVQVINEVNTYTGRKPSQDVIQDVKVDDEKARKFENAQKWLKKTSNWSLGLIILGYIFAIAVGLVLSLFTTLSEEMQSQFVLAIFTIFLIMGILIYILRKIFRNRASEQGLTIEETTYHNLCKSIESYQDGRYRDASKYIQSSKELLEIEENSPFDPIFRDSFVEYARKIEEVEDGEEFIKNTYGVVSNKLLHYLATVEYGGMETYTNSIIEEKSEIEYTPKTMTISYISDIKNKLIVKISLPFIFALPLIIFIYFEIGETIAQFILLVMIAILQMYYNYSRGR